MDNEKNTGRPEKSDWFDDLISPLDGKEEITADEQAASSSDLGDLSDMEVEKIIRETIAENWGSDPLPQDTSPVENQNRAAADDGTGIHIPESIEEATPETVYADVEEEDSSAVPRKVRPRKKGGYGLFGIPHLISTFLWIFISVAIGVSLGRLIWVCATDVLAFGREDRKVSITITAADTLDSVTNKLHNAGLIKYPQLFKVYAQLAKVEEKGKISVGTFELNTLYDYHALVGGLSATSSYRQSIEVMIPEGYTCAQIYKLLEEEGVCTQAELENYAMTSQFSDYWFLDGVERGSKYCLEGFLFPDTYKFYKNDTPRRVFSKLLSTFDHKFSDEMKNMLTTLNKKLDGMYKSHGLSQEYIDSHQMTVRDVVIIASMIEKESAHTGEIRQIASVIYNRLTNPSEYPKLNIDATLVYALGSKKDLTLEDLKLDSPYNTYLYNGLPPTPISNPGLFSLKGAMNPADTNYHFYALDKGADTRRHQFFETYKEHQNFLESQKTNEKD